MSRYCEIVPRTRKLHFMQSKDMYEIVFIQMRKHTCFYVFCVGVEVYALDQCENDGYVKQWKYVIFNIRGPHSITSWKEMHAKEVVQGHTYRFGHDLSQKNNVVTNNGYLK